ncbi:ATP synthase j chain-domain-containing protein [Kockiozyma suomiensis]|uniref:ATP synthase j chain-domain-containing protein n=1 Tax=Kockiozyma suomiensis TaxID=1337062 RepID=UPI003343E40D
MAQPAIFGSFLGWKKYPTPIMKPLWPFAVGAVVTYYAIGKAATAMMDSDEFKNDPRNPNFGKKH